VLEPKRVPIGEDDDENPQENADAILEGLIIGSADKAELTEALSNFAP
jgi:hypothetical protein